jgi:hypothetical protein
MVAASGMARQQEIRRRGKTPSCRANSKSSAVFECGISAWPLLGPGARGYSNSTSPPTTSPAGFQQPFGNLKHGAESSIEHPANSLASINLHLSIKATAIDHASDISQRRPWLEGKLKMGEILAGNGEQISKQWTELKRFLLVK